MFIPNIKSVDGDAAADCCLAFSLNKHCQDNESCGFDSALASSLLDAQKRFGGSETMRQVELEGVGT